MFDNRPNIVLFTTDQHRGDHLSLAGHPIVQTPFMDHLAKRGAYFPNAYSSVTSTPGARRCLLGGQDGFSAGLIGYSSHEWLAPTTLAQELANQGYHCINVGWRNLHPRRKLYGFHNVICHELRETVDDYLTWLRGELGPRATEFHPGLQHNTWLARPWSYPERFHPTVWTTDVAIDQIERRDPTRPFFIWISHLRPHSPYDPPQGLWDMYIDRELPEIPIGDWAAENGEIDATKNPDAAIGRLSPDKNQRMRAGYMGNVTFIDHELGRLRRHLHFLKLHDNTMWVFTADHGDMMGDHHLHRKSLPFEGSARIPFVVRYPDTDADLPVGTFEQPVGLQDVMPTILDYVGAPIPETCTGSSVLKAIRGEPWREFVHGEHSGKGPWSNHYITDGKEKFVYFPETGRELFFDLTTDRGERRDLAGRPEAAERVELWRRRMIEHLAPRGDGFSDGEKLLTKPDGWDCFSKPELSRELPPEWKHV